jgi:hypothetical protein
VCQVYQMWALCNLTQRISYAGESSQDGVHFLVLHDSTVILLHGKSVSMHVYLYIIWHDIVICFNSWVTWRSQDSPVSIVTELWAEQLGFNSQWGRDVFTHCHIQISSASHQPPIQWVLGTLSLGVKQPGHHLHLVPRLRMCRSRLHSPLCPHGMVLSETRNIFTFTLCNVSF